MCEWCSPLTRGPHQQPLQPCLPHPRKPPEQPLGATASHHSRLLRLVLIVPVQRRFKSPRRLSRSLKPGGYVEQHSRQVVIVVTFQNQDGRPLQEPPHGVLWGLYSDGRDYLRVRLRLSPVDHTPPDSLDSGSAFPDWFGLSVRLNPLARNNVVLGVGLGSQYSSSGVLGLWKRGAFGNRVCAVLCESAHSASEVALWPDAGRDPSAIALRFPPRVKASKMSYVASVMS